LLCLRTVLAKPFSTPLTMGCKGSKTAAVSQPQEQPAGEKTLLQEPAAEIKTETPQESATPATTVKQDTALESPAVVPAADAANAPNAAESSVEQVPADTTADKDQGAKAQDDLQPIVPAADAANAPNVAESSAEQVPADTTADKEQGAKVQDDLKPIVENDAQVQKQELAPDATATPAEKLATVETPATETPEPELPKVGTTSATVGMQAGCMKFCTSTEAQSELVVPPTAAQSELVVQKD